MTEHLNNDQWSAPTGPASIDPLLQARLDRMAQRNAAPPFAPAAASQTQHLGSPTDAPSATQVSVRTPAGKPGRRHAAKGSRKAALAISLGATGALSGLFAVLDGGFATASGGNPSTDSAMVVTSVVGAATVDSAASSTSAAATGPATPTTAMVAVATAVGATARTVTTMAATPADTTTKATTATTANTGTVTTAAAKSTTTVLGSGTYTGSSISTKWGPVQVAITVAAGKITDVATLLVPTDDRKSVQINNRATPVLRSEALTAQSASIANVSGATYTSTGYARSLQSAIDKARSGTTTQAA